MATKSEIVPENGSFIWDVYNWFNAASRDNGRLSRLSVLKHSYRLGVKSCDSAPKQWILQMASSTQHSAVKSGDVIGSTNGGHDHEEPAPTAAPVIRVAVVQLECHPSITIGANDNLSEPFVPNEGTPCLQNLRDHGIDVRDLQGHCRESYLVWHGARVVSVLRWLLAKPRQARPDLIIFPEGSIPRQLLFVIRAELEKQALEQLGVITDSQIQPSIPVVIAGTHAFEDGHGAYKDYHDLKIPESNLKKLRGRRAGSSVLTIFEPDSEGRIQIRLRAKREISPQEQVGIGCPMSSENSEVEEVDQELLVSLPVASSSKPPDMNAGSHKVRILALICSEALQYLGGKRLDQLSPDMVVVVSNDAAPENFSCLLEHLAANQIPSVYCNDGAAGRSGIALRPDCRGENWLYKSPRKGRLPEGDAVLLMQITLRTNAPEVGVHNPRFHHRLLSVAPVVSENEHLAEWRAQRTIDAARQRVETAYTGRVSLDMRQLQSDLSGLMERGGPTPTQEMIIERLLQLSEIGHAPLAEWEAFGGAAVIQKASLELVREVLRKCCRSDLLNATLRRIVTKGRLRGVQI